MADLRTDYTDASPSATDHAASHNAIGVKVNDLVNNPVRVKAATRVAARAMFR